MHRNIIMKAFKATLPILTGYLFLGAAFGLLLHEAGYGWWWCLLMSGFIYAGSMQFATVGLLQSAFNPLYAAILTLSINIRHIFYGLSMLKPFASIKKHRWYMIFALSDEAYSLLIKDIDEPETTPDYMFYVLLLSQIYWIVGSLLGNLSGNFLPFIPEGISFAMTALFVVIFIEKLETKHYKPIIIGLASSLLAIYLVSKEHFILLAMVFIIIFLTLDEGFSHD